MRPDYYKYELIDQYLSGQLSGKELEDFEKRVREDPDWNSSVKRQKLAHQLLIEQRIIKAKAFIQAYDEDKPGNGSIKNWIIGSLAGVLILAAFLYVYTQEKKQIASIAVAQQEQSKAEEKKQAPKNELRKHPLPSGNSAALRENNDHMEKSIHENSIQIDSLEILNNPGIHSQKEEAPIFTDQPRDTQAKTIPEKKSCDGLIDWSVTLTPACQDQATGILDIHDVKGGKAPYLYSIDGGKTFHPLYSFGFLESGTYAVLVKDANGCQSEIRTERVDVKNCETAKEYIFNPYQGETWNFPVGDKKRFKISILNREGKLVYQLSTSSGHPDFWDGKDMAHNYSEAGIHYYLIEFEDGTVKEGYITIIM